MVDYAFRLLQCCLVTDGGGALIPVAAERARDFPQKPVDLLGIGERVETPMVSQMEDFHLLARLPGRRPQSLRRGAGITHNDIDHLMIYDAFAHLPTAPRQASRRVSPHPLFAFRSSVPAHHVDALPFRKIDWGR